MKRDQKHTQPPDDSADLTTGLSSRSDVPWEKSREEVWSDISVKLQEKGQSEQSVRPILPLRQRYALAAGIAFLLAMTGFARFYSVTNATSSGKHASLHMPDGTRIELNAQTRLKYHPYWWRIARTIKLDGEAWFEVEKGKPFKVLSAKATTEVLGTTFNVLSRDMEFRVTCHTGKVKVSSKTSNSSIILTSKKQAHMTGSGILEVISTNDERNSPGWTDNLLMFVSAPLRLVFDEIERQYGIIIVSSVDLSHLYSGNFALDESVENVLTLLCRPFDLTYAQTSGKTYQIHQVPME